jgi:hypothetical protein
MMGRMITERVIAKAIWPIARVIPPAENADNGRTQDTGSAVQCHHKNGEADKKWQGVYRQHEDQPAEQANASKIQEKSEGEHGGGSISTGIWLRLPPPPRRKFEHAIETRRSYGDATAPWWCGR